MWFETVGNIKDEWKLIGHGDAGETSIVMAHRPGVCDPAKAARPAERHYSDSLKITEMNLLNFREIMPVHMAMRVKDVSETGAMLEPSLYPGADTGGWMENANPQTALEMRDAIVKLVVEFLPEFEKIEFDKI
jgi:hypothetical protein